MEADPQEAQHALHITNQNLSQNRLVEQERVKLGEGAFINTVKTLTQSVNDLRANFESYESHLASELEHKCTASASEAVVARINKAMRGNSSRKRLLNTSL